MSKRLLVVLIALSMTLSCLFMTGCSTDEDDFPILYFPGGAAESQISIIQESPSMNDFHELTVALPLSEDTVDLLMKLYYAKNNDLFPVEMTGADISIEYLSAISTPWVVNTITTTSVGETAESINTLEQQGLLPDIFLAADMNEMIDQETIIPFDQYLSDNSSILASTVYLNSLEALRTEQGHYGLPFYSTVYLLTGSREFLPEDGVPAYIMSEDELHEFIRDIRSSSSDGTTYVTRFYDADSLIPYMGDDLSESLHNEGLTSLTDAYGADPRVSRSCGMWLMNSGEIDTWSYYYPDGLYFTMLPTERVNAVVYPVCLSSDCEDPEFASGFASFICFDRDAQMLLRRLEPLRGFFPPVTTRGVWDQISSDELFGAQSMLYEQYMNDAVYTIAGD